MPVPQRFDAGYNSYYLEWAADLCRQPQEESQVRSEKPESLGPGPEGKSCTWLSVSLETAQATTHLLIGSLYNYIRPGEVHGLSGISLEPESTYIGKQITHLQQ